MFARFDENPAMTLQVIKKTKRYGRREGRTDGRTDNVKTVYPTTNKVCGGYNKKKLFSLSSLVKTDMVLGKKVRLRLGFLMPEFFY